MLRKIARILFLLTVPACPPQIAPCPFGSRSLGLPLDEDLIPEADLIVVREEGLRRGDMLLATGEIVRSNDQTFGVIDLGGLHEPDPDNPDRVVHYGEQQTYSVLRAKTSERVVAG